MYHVLASFPPPLSPSHLSHIFWYFSMYARLGISFVAKGFLFLFVCYTFSGRSIGILVIYIQRLLTWLENLSQISLILEKFVNPQSVTDFF